jgi:hypothetical protein
VPIPGKYTGLFFLDDATALAAGHRPCALCRREDYDRLRDSLALGGADSIDLQLHAERLGPRPSEQASTLPDGAFVLYDGAPHVVWDGLLRRWSFAGYGPPRTVAGPLEVITPASLVSVLRAGWEPVVPFFAGGEAGSAAP